MWSTDRVLAASHDWQWVPPDAEELLIEDIVVIDYPEWASMGFVRCLLRQPILSARWRQYVARPAAEDGPPRSGG